MWSDRRLDVDGCSSIDGLELQHHRLESVVVNSHHTDKALDGACIRLWSLGGRLRFTTPTVEVCFALSLRIILVADL